VSPSSPDRAAQRALVERFAREHPTSVLHDPAAGTLLDVASGKVLALDWTRVAGVDERREGGSQRPYLAIRLDDGAELALADAGVAFAPVTTATGPLGGLPQAVCFRDLGAAEARLAHFLDGHPGEPPSREHVSLFMFCLAVVDGARAAGFDVSAEERRLDALLARLEGRRRG
jgi:hypothetical protein